MLRNIGLLIHFTLLSIALMGCSGHIGDGGGGDPGGGTSLHASSFDEVKAATWQAREFLINNRVFFSLRNNYQWNKTDKTEVEVSKIFGTMSNYLFSNEKNGPLDPVAIIKTVPLYFSPTDCIGGPEHNIKDASVSKNNYDGKICLSLSRLSRFTANNLKQNMIIILAHEYTHIFKYGEREADLITEFFTKNIKTILTEDNSYLRYQIIKSAKQLKRLVDEFTVKFKSDEADEIELEVFIAKFESLTNTIFDFLPYPAAYPQMQLDIKRYQVAIHSITLVGFSNAAFKYHTHAGYRDSSETWKRDKLKLANDLHVLQSVTIKLYSAITDYLDASGSKMMPYADREIFEATPDSLIELIENWGAERADQTALPEEKTVRSDDTDISEIERKREEDSLFKILTESPQS